MRIIVAEGLVKQYYHYADMKRSEILDLRKQLNAEGPEEAVTDDEE